MANPTRVPPLYGPNGGIVAPTPLAAQAGIDLLQEGGSAMDAAVAAALVAGLVDGPENHLAVLQSVGFTGIMPAMAANWAGSGISSVWAALLKELGSRSLYDLRRYAAEAAAKPDTPGTIDIDWFEPVVAYGPDGAWRLVAVSDRATQVVGNALRPMADQKGWAADGQDASQSTRVGRPPGGTTGPGDSRFVLAVDHRGGVVELAFSTTADTAREACFAASREGLNMLIGVSGTAIEQVTKAVRLALEVDESRNAGGRVQAAVESLGSDPSGSRPGTAGLAVLAIDFQKGLVIGSRDPTRSYGVAVY